MMSNCGDLTNIEDNIPIGYKGQPLEDIIGAKRSNNNTNTLKAP